MRECMQNAGTALLTENEALKRRIAEVAAERDTLVSVAQQEREHLRSAQDRMTDALGEAAKKPAPNAYATANSTGTASTQSDQTAGPGTPVNVTTTTPPVNVMTPPVNVTTPALPVVLPEHPAPTVRAAEPAPRAAAAPSCTPQRTGRGRAGSSGMTACAPAARAGVASPPPSRLDNR